MQPSYYQNLEIHDHRVRGSCPMVWPKLSYNENVLDFRNFSSLIQHIFEKNKMHGYKVHEALYQKCEIHGPWIRSHGKAIQ